MNLDRNCRHCDIALTILNAAKKTHKYFRNECKPCRSKIVLSRSVGNPKRQAYVRTYLRRIGKVKEYPCETCSKLCYKKYVRAFCSDKCRFMAYVNKEESCWVWTGPLNRRGYGKISYKDNKTAIASRVAYEIFNGSIESGKFICHTCDIPRCVNPLHLWVGTHVENMADMARKGRAKGRVSKKIKEGV